MKVVAGLPHEICVEFPKYSVYSDINLWRKQLIGLASHAASNKRTLVFLVNSVSDGVQEYLTELFPQAIIRVVQE